MTRTTDRSIPDPASPQASGVGDAADAATFGGPKPWYQSLGVWASLVTLAAGVLRLCKVRVDPSAQRDAAEWLLSAATLAGGGGALWGRWRATRRIGAATTDSAPAPDASVVPTASASTPDRDEPDDFDASGNAASSKGAVASRAGRAAPRANWPAALLGIAFVFSLGSLGGCAALQSPAEAYVGADRATYDAVAPEYSAYVAADPSLADDQRARRARTVQTWRLRLEQAEKSQASSSKGPGSSPAAAPLPAPVLALPDGDPKP